MLKPASILRASWSNTLHLPKSSLPPRPAIPSPYLAQCTSDLYKWQSSQKDRPKYILHDGPPYANGSLHLGHALNKILKDIICRFQISQGKRVEYVPGWDCHGLPIEVKALQALKKSHDTLSPIAVRKAARKLAEKTIEEQKAGFKEWAVMGDWDNAYKTMDPAFELRQLNVFKAMVEKGLIYRARMPVYWSPSSQTALAEAELEYDPEHKSKCANVLYHLNLNENHEFAKIDGKLLKQLGALIWTTTPWTLPANRAIAVNKQMKYCIVELQSSPGSYILVGESRLDHLRSAVPDDIVNIIKSGISGEAIAGAVTYKNPFNLGQEQPIISADFVTDTMGTGIVHMAPGHGHEDYLAAKAHGLDPHAPVDHRGQFTAEALPSNPGILQGKLVGTEGSEAVLSYLKCLEDDQTLFVVATHTITHKYPIDWRTKEPVIIRATDQWFADIDSIKDAAIKSLDAVQFIPESGKQRLHNFIAGRSQWCISRQRSWGLPIPALYRVDVSPEEPVMTADSINHIIKVIKERGIDAWWSDAENELAWIPAGLEGKYVRGKDTMDVWFDSGTSWSQLDLSTNQSPADLYLEGTDQHRGWFQSSLLTFIAQQIAQGNPAPVAPFKSNITHGFALDSDGRKMSKSLGNIVVPSEIMNGTLLPPLKPQKNKGKSKGNNPLAPKFDAMGADVLRFWAASVDYTKDVSIGPTVLKTVQADLTKIRITFKWLLGVLSSWDPSNYESKTDNTGTSLIDSIAVRRLSIVSSAVHSSYTSNDYARAITTLSAYVHTDLSSFYFETLKDRMYAGSLQDRIAAQNTLVNIFNELLTMLGPITPLLVEEIWSLTPTQIKAHHGHPLQRIWQPLSLDMDHEASRRADATYSILLSVKKLVGGLMEKQRNDGKMGSSLQCNVTISIQDRQINSADTLLIKTLFSKEMAEVFESALVVSRVTFEEMESSSETDQILIEDESCEKDAYGEHNKYLMTAMVEEPNGDKCDRCWRYLELHEGLCGRCTDVVQSEHCH
jgi:isoleucyl-tRNA synthetase